MPSSRETVSLMLLVLPVYAVALLQPVGVLLPHAGARAVPARPVLHPRAWRRCRLHLVRCVENESTVPLPDGWQAQRDPSSGMLYYVDLVNRVSQWEVPTAPAVPATPVPALEPPSQQPTAAEDPSAGTLLGGMISAEQNPFVTSKPQRMRAKFGENAAGVLSSEQLSKRAALEDGLAADLARFKADPTLNPRTEADSGPTMMQNVINTLGKILTFNFFLIIIFFLWFLTGVGMQCARTAAPLTTAVCMSARVSPAACHLPPAACRLPPAVPAPGSSRGAGGSAHSLQAHPLPARHPSRLRVPWRPPLRCQVWRAADRGPRDVPWLLGCPDHAVPHDAHDAYLLERWPRAHRRRREGESMSAEPSRYGRARLGVEERHAVESSTWSNLHVGRASGAGGWNDDRGATLPPIHSTVGCMRWPVRSSRDRAHIGTV